MRAFWMGFFGSVLGVIVALVLLGVTAAFVISAIIAQQMSPQERALNAPLPDSGFVLELDLRISQVDYPTEGNPRYVSNSPSLIATLDAAAEDSRVLGVFVIVDASSSVGLAEEVSGAIERFRATGKPVIAHVPTLYAGAVLNLLAASSADEVWMSPAGFAHITRPRRGADLERLRFGLEKIAEHRNLDPDTLRDAVSNDALPAARAQELGLIDQIGVLDEARNHAMSGARGVVSFERYAKALPKPDGQAVVAMIEVGSLQHYENLNTAYANRAVEALDAAMVDPAVHAIVLRVNAHDTSDTAAYRINAAVQRAQREGKVVIANVVRLADANAYIAVAHADRIVAPALSLIATAGEPGTSLDWEEAQSEVQGEPAPDGYDRLPFQSWGEIYSEEPHRTQTDSLFYRQYVEHVSEARDLPISRVHELSRGAVWTGTQAVDNGLADQVGGVYEALVAARDLGGVSPDETIRLKHLPEREEPHRGLRFWLENRFAD